MNPFKRFLLVGLHNNALRRFRPGIAKISVTSPIVINVPNRELLAGETKSSFNLFNVFNIEITKTMFVNKYLRY